MAEVWVGLAADVAGVDEGGEPPGVGQTLAHLHGTFHLRQAAFWGVVGVARTDLLIAVAADRAAATGIEPVLGRHAGDIAAGDHPHLQPQGQHRGGVRLQRQIDRRLGGALHIADRAVADAPGRLQPSAQAEPSGRIERVVGIVGGEGEQGPKGGEVTVAGAGDEVGGLVLDRAGLVQGQAIGDEGNLAIFVGQVGGQAAAAQVVGWSIVAIEGGGEFQGLIDLAPVRQGEFGLQPAVDLSQLSQGGDGVAKS